MKKIIAMLLVLSSIMVFASCDKNQEEDGKTLETAETYFEITGNAGSITLDENTARILLEVYGKESLGLSKDIYDYELKLSATRFLDNDACLVEAFIDGAQTPEGTFIILGQQCFVYDSKQQKYLLLTVNGAKDFSANDVGTTDASGNTTEKSFKYDENNNEKLHEKFSSYSMKTLGLEKELSEYILVVPGTSTTAENGETVYVIRLYEKNGEATNITLAFNENGNYVYDFEINRYVKL